MISFKNEEQYDKQSNSFLNSTAVYLPRSVVIFSNIIVIKREVSLAIKSGSTYYFL